jgi:heme/copper-type cytochrome/quinol oxidase subunit 3
MPPIEIVQKRPSAIWSAIRFDNSGKLLHDNSARVDVQLSSAQRRALNMNSPFKTNFQSQHGQSLVSVLISVAIMGIVMMAFVSMMMSQQREITKVNQKMASLDIQRVLTAALANSSNVCNYLNLARKNT